jgi:hypothetical protein
MIGSKDTIHVLRLSPILHILDGYLKRKMNPGLYVGDDSTDTVISAKTVSAARLLYHNIAQKKSIFLEVNYTHI